MNRPRNFLHILGRALLTFSVAVTGTVLTAAPALASAPIAVHGAYGDDPYGSDPEARSEDPYDQSPTALSPTTTTTSPATTTTGAAVDEGPIVEAANLTVEAPVAVAPSTQTAPEAHDTLPHTGSGARAETLIASSLIGLGTVLRAFARRTRKAAA